MSEYSGKKIAIIGMAATGMAAAEVMKSLGADVVIYDRKNESDLKQALEKVHKFGVDARVGSDDVDLTGVDLLVTSPGVPKKLPAFADAQARGIEVISEIELAYRISKAPIIAITGTNGKTTTTVLTGKIMMADGRDTYIAGNVVAGDIRLPLITAAYKATSESVIVAEVSTFQLEWIKNFKPKCAVLLNVSKDHLDRHASIEEYANLKKRIFENQTKDDFSITNAENAITSKMIPSLSGHVLQFARKFEVEEGGFVRGDELIIKLGGRKTVICKRSDIPIRGEHNVENVLAAGCMAIAFGVKPESILKAVREFKPIEHRLEPVAVIDGVEYINNSMCTNVEAAVRSVEAIDEPQIIIAGGKDKGSDYTALGEAFKKKAKHVILIGADAGLLQKAAEKAGFDAILRADSLENAVRTANDLAKPGDVVVLTPGCASFDMFSSFEHRGNVFKQAVKALQSKKK